jgi:hypothetical protein
MTREEALPRGKWQTTREELVERLRGFLQAEEEWDGNSQDICFWLQLIEIVSSPCACGELLDALIWCSGSQDFGPGGIARKGWLKKCKPLLDRLLPAEETGEHPES